MQLRTQFHHIDASAQLEAVARRREKESAEGAKPAEPKAFLPTVKKAGGDTAAEATQAFMKSANQEVWQRLRYEDEDVSVPLHMPTATDLVHSQRRPMLPTASGSSSPTPRPRPSCSPTSTTASSSTPSAPRPAAKAARRRPPSALQTS